MTNETFHVVAFLLVAFAAFAVPTTLAYLLFGLLRREDGNRQVSRFQRHSRRFRESRWEGRE